MVLTLLALAGLLRPEAWLFAFAYLAYKRDLKLLPWAAAAPVLWMAHDLVLAGDPLHSLLGTRDNAETLQRITGLGAVPGTVPRRLGEILREPGLFGAAAGGLLVLALQRRRAALPIAAGFVSIAAFCVLAGAGLPILGRYLLLPAALLAVFCGAGAFGWLRYDGRWRTAWAVIGAAVLAAFVAFAPGQIDRIRDLRASMHTQAGILSDLHAITDDVTCRPVTVPNHRPVPHVALWTGIPPGEIVSAQLERPTRGAYIDPASERVLAQLHARPERPEAPHGDGAAGLQRSGEQRLLAPLRALLTAREASASAEARRVSASEHSQFILSVSEEMDRAPDVEVGLQGRPPH